ncbi:MAG: PEP-CTERM sorting domain-containing protein [Planctomycetaceae bacterium]|jgi:hypothetical protein|nr:PEP-CTERM sorting domain-containing protein [Planctomycetaceae bacterium]
MNAMNRFWLMACLIVAIISSVGNGYSDTLYCDVDSRRLDYVHYFQMIHDPSNNGWHNAETIKIINDDTGQDFRVFCIDYFTPTATEFNNPLVGQEYDAIALNSPSMTLYSQIQKDALNSLFSHVYSTVYDANGDIIDDVNSYLYQLIVWEIIHETNETWNIAGGEFGIQNAAYYPNPNDHKVAYLDTNFYNLAVNTINSWLNAIAGNITWDSIGYGAVTDNQLTVYVAEGGQNISQTFISVVSPITPEPATILMFGIGMMFALPLMRRTRKIFSHS